MAMTKIDSLALFSAFTFTFKAMYFRGILHRSEEKIEKDDP